MSVREYVGARYVPVFAEPLEWDSTKAYEPLTIVTYQGASYTSRQAVPIGIQISNNEYWAQTGNYSAQIEQYRKEVQTFDGRITANATATAANATATAANAESITELREKQDRLTPESNVMNYKTDSNTWQDAVNAITGSVLYIPAENILVNEGITIPANITKIVCDGKITVTTELNYLFTVPPKTDYIENRDVFQVEGLNVEGSGVLKNVINCAQSQSRFSCCKFKDFTGTGIYTTAGGFQVINCSFVSSAKTTPRVGTCTGVQLGPDAVVTNNQFLGMANAVIIGAGSTIMSNYMWGYQQSNKTYGIKCGGVSLLDIIGNSFDGVTCALYNVAGTVEGNFFLYNGSEYYYTQPWCVMECTQGSPYGLVFANNNFNLFNSFTYELHTFQKAALTNAYLRYYESYANHVWSNVNTDNFYVGFAGDLYNVATTNHINILAPTVQGFNIKIKCWGGNNNEFTTCIGDSGGNVNAYISNTMGSAKWANTPTGKKTRYGIVVENALYGAFVEQINTRYQQSAFEIIPATTSKEYTADSSAITVNTVKTAMSA